LFFLQTPHFILYVLSSSSLDIDSLIFTGNYSREKELTMLKTTKSITVVLVITLLLSSIAGCQNSAQECALIGATIGTGIGAIAGGDPGSMVVGGFAGGGIGYWVGNEMDKNRANVANGQESGSQGSGQSSRVVWVTNSNGSRTPVELAENASGYVGPRNEYYASLPTERQLRPVYGF
jgi:hypothetical protein